jgi:hypothetical protein
MVGTDPGTWAPVEVTPEMNGSTITIVPGQAANFVGLPESKTGYAVVSDMETVVAAHSAKDDTTFPGFHGVAAGTAKVTVYDGDPAESASAQPIVAVTVVVEAPQEGAVDPADETAEDMESETQE